MATVRIPFSLRVHTAGEAVITARGTTIAELLDDLDTRHPGIRGALIDATGVRRFVNIYLDDEDIRFLDGLDTVVAVEGEVSILGAIAGG